MAITRTKVTQASHVSTRAQGRNKLGQFTKGGGTSVVVDGVDALVRELTFRAATVRPLAAAVVVRHADQAAQRMRNTVPIGPPRLHVLNSITSDQTPSGDGTKVWADAGPDPAADAGAFVARFLEHGTVHMAPRPFVGPALDATIPGFVEDIKKLTFW